MRKNIYFILLLSFFQVTAQQLTSKASVSVITCGPGNELYSTFGHSAFRVYDSNLGIDKIYNYGTFDFNAPNFYVNFAKGNLIYQLSTSTFSRFLRVYHYENRWVKAQELNLDTLEVQAIYDFLENNAKPENRSYRYDFFYDNCSTKIEEVIKIVLKERVTFNNSHIKSSKSHRDLIADYTNNHLWSKFGIDLALGSVIDNQASKDEYKFLPDYIYQAFNNATIGNDEQPLVKNTRIILNQKPSNINNSIVSPFLVFLFISLLLIFVTFKNYRAKKRTRWIDFVLYLTTGLVGVVVLLLWFSTTHTATYQNYNFVWAFAPNLVIAFYMFKKKFPNWIIFYNWLLLVLLVMMLLLWVAKVQVFNIALLPFVIALFVRYRYLTLSK